MDASKNFLSSMQKRVKEKGIIDEGLINQIEEIFPNSSLNILNVIKRGISKYKFQPSGRNVWIITGQSKRHYLLLPKIYCSCVDFYQRVVINRKRTFCKHMMAQIISEALNLNNEIEKEDSEFSNVIKLTKLNL